MTSNLKQRISSIENEVKDLHPLLETIFRKMEQVEKVEYTHGPNEKGADFVLTKKSELLGDTEHVGVIAKTGKITQSIRSIDEQIEECTLKRVSSNGKKEFYLSEILVVVNGTISRNAQEKIFEKYKTQKIKFVDINTLTDLALKYFPDYGINVKISDTNFLAKQVQSCTEREGKFNLLGGEQSKGYISPEIIKVNEDFSKDEKVPNIFKEIEESSFISIESQMGGGKTKLLNTLTLHFSNLETYKNKKILPIYINSKDILNSDKDLEQIAADQTELAQLEHDPERKYLLLVDGIDEVKMSDERLSSRLSNLIDQACQAKALKLVIASRNISNENLESNRNFTDSRYQIKPLRLKEMIRFLENLCDGINTKNRLIEDLKKSDLFKVLPKTPIAAIILAKLLSEGSEELPMNLTELYSKYCELSLGRWDIDKGLKTQREFEALEVLVAILAEYMLENEIPALSKAEALNIFKEYLEERNLNLDRETLFESMLERSGIIVESKDTNTISFKHRSFAEFFYAKKLTSRQNLTIDENVFHPYWSNSFYFYVGLKRDCPELLQAIIDTPIKHEGHRLCRIANLGNLLLAGYQSPTSTIENGLQAVFKDAGSYYKSIYEDKTDSVLGKLPPIHVLALITSIMEEGYNYNFFEESISNTFEEILTTPNDADGKAYSLFFLDVIRHQLSGGAIFDKLINHYEDKLPIVLQLAINHESENNKYKSPAIKKIQKRLTKHKKSLQFRSGIEKLYRESSDGKTKLSKLSQLK